MKTKKLAKQVIILEVVSLFTDFASEMLYPVTPIFLTSFLGASMAIVGLIEGIAEITAGILKGYFGVLSDQKGKRSPFVVLGYGLSALVKPLPGLFPWIPTVVFSRVADRVGKGIRTAPRDALLSNYADGNSGAVFGFHRGMDTLGAVIGPIVALILLSIYNNDYVLVYLLAFIPSVFAVISTLFVKDVPVETKTKRKESYLTLWKNAPSAYKNMVMLITVFSLVNSSDVFLILKSKSISHSDTTAIMGYVFYNIVFAFASYPLGLIADKFGKRNMFVSGLFVFSLVYLGFAFDMDMKFIWVLFAFYGIYAASTEGVAKAWVSDLIPNELRGTAIGFLSMMMSLAVMVGSVIAGVLWDSVGPWLPFLISSIVSAVVGVVLLFKRNQ